jgi:nucleoside-diphosphate-sugar epimerase
MRVLVIGGTGFLGSYVVRDLLAEGHEVAVFHRGATGASAPRHILGDRNRIEEHAGDLRGFAPEVAIDMVLASATQARAMMRVLRGVARRVVAISSGDVYQGDERRLPLTEDSPLRTELNPYPADTLDRIAMPWIAGEYEKILVERAVMDDPTLPATVLRLPMVYGPGDRENRVGAILAKASEPQLVLDDPPANCCFPHGYVENVAAAIVLAPASEGAAGRIYNVAEPELLTEAEWTQRVLSAAGSSATIVVAPKAGVRRNLAMSSARIRAELGYVEPVPVADALARSTVGPSGGVR